VILRLWRSRRVYQISLRADVERTDTWGDGGSLERVVINLVQNAIQHGGRQGTISVAVRSPSTIEISDQGPGIPSSERERNIRAVPPACGRSIAVPDWA